MNMAKALVIIADIAGALYAACNGHPVISAFLVAFIWFV
jgi:hypothetical protein